MLQVTFLSSKYQIDLSRYLPSRGALAFYIWAVAVCIVIAYLFRFIIGRKRTDDLTSKVLDALARIYQRAR